MYNLDRAKIIKGDPYPIMDSLKIRHPKIGEIIDFGEEEYQKAVSLFTITSYDVMVELWDMGLYDYEAVPDYSVFIMLYQNGEYQKHMRFLFGDVNFVLKVNEINNLPFLHDEKNGAVLDLLGYDIVSSFLRMINRVDDSEREKVSGGSKALKRILVEDKRYENEYYKTHPRKRESSLLRYISALAWANTSGLSYDDIMNLRIYQFYDGLTRLAKIKSVDHIYHGIYAGTVDYKKIKKSELDWTAD